jgi:hypothetical protein
MPIWKAVFVLFFSALLFCAFADGAWWLYVINSAVNQRGIFGVTEDDSRHVKLYKSPFDDKVQQWWYSVLTEMSFNKNDYKPIELSSYMANTFFSGLWRWGVKTPWLWEFKYWGAKYTRGGSMIATNSPNAVRDWSFSLWLYTTYYIYDFNTTSDFYSGTNLRIFDEDYNARVHHIKILGSQGVVSSWIGMNNQPYTTATIPWVSKKMSNAFVGWYGQFSYMEIPPVLEWAGFNFHTFSYTTNPTANWLKGGFQEYNNWMRIDITPELVGGNWSQINQKVVLFKQGQDVWYALYQCSIWWPGFFSAENCPLLSKWLIVAEGQDTFFPMNWVFVDANDNHYKVFGSLASDNVVKPLKVSINGNRLILVNDSVSANWTFLSDSSVAPPQREAPEVGWWGIGDPEGWWTTDPTQNMTWDDFADYVEREYFINSWICINTKYDDSDYRFWITPNYPFDDVQPTIYNKSSYLVDYEPCHLNRPTYNKLQCEMRALVWNYCFWKAEQLHGNWQNQWKNNTGDLIDIPWSSNTDDEILGVNVEQIIDWVQKLFDLDVLFAPRLGQFEEWKNYFSQFGNLTCNNWPLPFVWKKWDIFIFIFFIILLFSVIRKIKW